MERLVEVVQRRARERAQRFVGRTLDVLVEGPSRTDPSRLRGRTRHNKVVNFTGLADAGRDRAGGRSPRATSQTLAGEESLLARAGRPSTSSRVTERVAQRPHVDQPFDAAAAGAVALPHSTTPPRRAARRPRSSASRSPPLARPVVDALVAAELAPPPRRGKGGSGAMSAAAPRCRGR